MSAAEGRAGRRFSLRPSTLRGRLAMLSGVAVFVAITFVGGAAFAVASRVISDEVDASLTSTGQLPTGATFSTTQICSDRSCWNCSSRTARYAGCPGGPPS